VKLDEEIIKKENAFTKDVKSKYPILPALLLPGDLIIFETTAIMRHLARNSPLYNGKDELGLIDSWMELFKVEIFEKGYSKVIFPILGYTGYTLKEFNEGMTNFKSFLPRLNKVGEYLVGSTLSIADIFAAALLHLPMALIVEEGMRKAFSKMTAWYNKVANDPTFVEVFGIPRFCKIALKPVLPPTEEKAGEAPQAEEKAKPGKKKNEDDDDDEEEKKKKEVNPLDQLKPSPFNLDDFKREFLANKTAEKRREYIKNVFFKKFDADGWALWLLQYDKIAGECEVLFKTSNLMDGFLTVIIPLLIMLG
jgi:elongation factor 1-gamma